MLQITTPCSKGRKIHPRELGPTSFGYVAIFARHRGITHAIRNANKMPRRVAARDLELVRDLVSRSWSVYRVLTSCCHWVPRDRKCHSFQSRCPESRFSLRPRDRLLRPSKPLRVPASSRRQGSARILAEQREPLIKISYASTDGEVKGFVYRKPPPNRFAMSEQDVDDVAFLTGKLNKMPFCWADSSLYVINNKTFKAWIEKNEEFSIFKEKVNILLRL